MTDLQHRCGNPQFATFVAVMVTIVVLACIGASILWRWGSL